MMAILQFQAHKSVIYKTMAESNHMPQEVSYATNAILVGEPYEGVRYTSLQLSGRGIAKPADYFGRGVIVPQLMITYWPGGADGVQPEMVFTTDLTDAAYADEDDPVLAERRRIRQIQGQIVGMGLADTTLVGGRYRKGPEARSSIDYDALGISYGEYVPLGAIAIGRVVSHNQLRPGDYVASLYVPERTTYPVFILEAMKHALPTNHRG